jgi:D-alanine--poly(phosphoribitol) ligase subunit 1
MDVAMIDPVLAILDGVRRRPNHPAVVSETDNTVSYGELWELARRMGACIAETAEQPRVLVQLPSGAPAYAAMLGSLLAGGFYAPVNVAAPVEKQRLVFDQFKPHIVVGRSDLYHETFAGIENPPRLLDISTVPKRQIRDERPSHKIAYVIFTSGSTGTPKGVTISRAALANYVTWALKDMAIGPDDRWSQHPNIGFDLSVLDIYGALCGGATLFPLSRNEARLMPASAIRRHSLTIWNSVPSVIDIMRRARQLTHENLSSLRLMTFCGEPLLPAHLDAIFDAHPDVIVHNTYGPTEATVSCTLIRLDRNNYREACASTVAIGEPIDNMSVFLLHGGSPDEGEIVLSGPQLAEGYWDDPQATTAAFRDIDVDAKGGRARAYFTGDWARRVDGKTYFSNRIDFQIKINGFRVELDEVNTALRKAGYASCACALVGGDLHAFLESEGPLHELALRQSLERWLEPYAIPKHFHLVQTLPRNANDKIDVKALVVRISGQGT